MSHFSPLLDNSLQVALKILTCCPGKESKRVVPDAATKISIVGYHHWVDSQLTIVIEHERDVAQSMILTLSRRSEVAEARTSMGRCIHL